VYKWKGEVNEDSESMLVIKTPEANVEAVTKLVRSLHSYETPEVIFFPVVGGSEPYLRWVHDVSRVAGRDE
jgi:periplasmic divalent cation tolerance protein